MSTRALRRPLLAVGRQLVWAATVLWVSVTVVWLLFLVAPDPNKALAAWNAGGSYEAIEKYEQARGFDRPLYVRYLDWLTRLATLDFGRSYVYPRAVSGLVADRVAVTLTYALPAVAVSTALATVAGLVGGTNPRGLVDRASQFVSNVGFGVPGFWLAVVSIAVAVEQFGFLPTDYEFWRGALHPRNLVRYAFPAAIVAINVGAVQFRYVRSEAITHARKDFVKLVEAKGGGRWTVVRHVFRNAVVSLMSLFVTEAFAILLLTTYVVERAFGVDGFGTLTLTAVRKRDVGVLFAIVLCLLCFVIAGRTLTNLTRRWLYPDARGGGKHQSS